MTEHQRMFPDEALLEIATVRETITATLNERPMVPGVTIDDPRAKDLDDAFWLERLPTGYRLLVSIADVASYIDSQKTPHLEKEAHERAYTIYLDDNTNSPMFPSHLSEDQLSLLEGQLRPTVTIALLLDEHLDPGEIQISRTCVCSRKRLSMSEADDAIEHPQDDIDLMLQLASILAQQLLQQRKRRGALALYDIVAGWATTEDGRLRHLGEGDRYHSHVIIHELMLLVNQRCALFLAERGIPALYRNHQAKPIAPERSTLGQMIETAIAHPESSRPEQVRATIDLALERAEYAPVVIGHFGLHLPAYIHLTSPLRRYADLVNQRILLAVLNKQALPYTKPQLEEIVNALNRKEREMKAMIPALFRSAYENVLLSMVGDAENASAALAGLDAKKFHSVLRMAVEGQVFSEAVEQEILSRLKQDRLDAHDMFTLLFRFQDRGDQWDRVRAAILHAIKRQPHFAVSLLFMGKQKLGWGEPDYEEFFSGIDHSRMFYAQVNVKIAEQHYISSTHMASKKVLAKQKACAEVVVRIAEREHA